MTSEQIELVTASFAKILPLSEEASVLFYARLFELDPDLRRLFKIDIREQGHKLIQMIGLAVGSLDSVDELLPVLRELGARHVDYGVKDADYETVGDALLWMLEKALKSEFTPEARQAWTLVYDLMANAMKGADSPSIESARSV